MSGQALASSGEPLGGFAERRHGVVLRQAAQGAVLELAHALAREAEPAAGLAQRVRLLAVRGRSAA